MDSDSRPNQDQGAPPPEERKPAEASDGGDERRRRGNRHHAFRRKNRRRRGEQTEPRGDERKGPTSAQMRHARASGRTPGISTANEPAAVPLGTDDEAAGMSPTRAELELELRRAELGEGMLGLRAADAMSGRPGHPSESLRSFGMIVTFGAAVVILAMLAIVLF